MQNKPNFLDAQMNVTFCKKMDYENKSNWKLGENKANQTQYKPNSRKAKMNVSSLITKDYRKKGDFAVQKNKPKQTQSCLAEALAKADSKRRKITGITPNCCYNSNW